MNDRKIHPGEIIMASASDPSMRKVAAVRNDFVEIAQAHGASLDEYGSALVAALAALIYGTAKGDVIERNVRVNMVIEGFNRHFAIYDKAGGIPAAIAELERRHG